MMSLPPLPYDEWIPTRVGLHLRLQILGKIRLALMPKRNHWWHVPLYVSARGLTTRPMPCAGDRLLEIEMDVLDDAVYFRCSDDETIPVPLSDGQTIQAFYAGVVDALSTLQIDNPIQHPVPFDAPSTVPFEEDTDHDAYDGAAVRRFWRALTHIQPVFQTFQGRYVGKDTPVHLFWHSFDLAYTRFSGREGPPMPGADSVTLEAYSHEVISFGFWAGDETTPQAGFYSYTYPEPEGLANQPLAPDAAVWHEGDNGLLAFLPYEAIRTADHPREDLLAFLESAYEAGAEMEETGFHAGLLRATTGTE